MLLQVGQLLIESSVAIEFQILRLILQNDRHSQTVLNTKKQKLKCIR